MTRPWANPVDDDDVPNEEPGLNRIANIAANVMDKFALSAFLARHTESPIETILGVEIMLVFNSRRRDLVFSPQNAMSKIADGQLIFVPQYKWRGYRADWAICVGQKPEAFIECDGRDFHSSLEQQARDAKRDAEIENAGIIGLRFSGSDIHSSPVFCAEEVARRVLGLAWRPRL